MQVHHLTIQENGRSQRFVYENRDEAMTRFADAIARRLDAKLGADLRGSRQRLMASLGRQAQETAIEASSA